ncbi:MAG: hypothetical protein GPOALKHO_001098 [Sodalis sp.]|uniref:hypothetical protein n=1 Tax=Sodalis sp. (in: enterobacteria) TaxID=1898979 RepID=UPI0038737572|nr:MAG: hypothetical protein GPOALKHO_001098 [Sodalis sp.]
MLGEIAENIRAASVNAEIIRRIMGASSFPVRACPDGMKTGIFNLIADPFIGIEEKKYMFKPVAISYYVYK